jgi:hypothetical protein
VTLIEPGGFDTDWSTSSGKRAAQIDAYDDARRQMAERRKQLPQGKAGATGSAILQIVDADPPPLRVFLGKPPLGIAKERYAQRLKTWEEWNDLAVAAQGD